MADKGIPSWPKVTIRLYDDHNAEVKIAGRSHPVNHHDPRQAAIQLVSERAAQLGRPVKATAVESDGASWPLIIHPDGRVESVDVDVKSKKPIWPIIVATVLAGLLIAGTVLWLVVLRKPSDNVTQPTVSPKLPELPGPSVGPDQFSARPVPPGWTATASWTVDLDPDTKPAVSPTGREVAIITQDEKIAVFDDTGKVLWQDKVPRGAESPVYTTIDGKPVVAVVAPESLYYWAGDGAEAVELELPNSASVQFFGASPLVVLGSEGGASVVSGGELKALPAPERLATLLLAEGDKGLSARYRGPLYWDQPGKETVTVQPAKPKGATGINHIVAASPGRALVIWNTPVADKVIPVVHDSTSGAAVATCPTSAPNKAAGWQWLPDQAGKVAAWGECLINFTTNKTSAYKDFQPQSITGLTIYGQALSTLVAGTPGGKFRQLQPGTARPWGVAGTRAIVVYDGTLYALDKK
ncbi:hypothetical protein [Kribbella sp. CA-293567]|uniref:hypothetical protein n=1 Tax=Kribbella sp. CA-293567 TaxID=3002436 RepID=UPI0022DD48FC|nr:hypothetical protein [Kribbella sp. CA-293567]WBQ05593.1 hypothetical protein OX958_02060 [Kribbella sp. CA-293567]